MRLTEETIITKGNTITNSTVLIRSDILKQTGGFDEDPYLKVEDYDLWIRLGEKGEFIFIPRIHAYYRIHANQFSGNWETKQKNLDYLAKKRNLSLPQYRFIRNKGTFLLNLRNSFHFLNYLIAMLGSLSDKISGESLKQKELKILMITARADYGGGPEHLLSLITNLSNRIIPYIAAPEDKPYFKRYSDFVGEERITAIPHRKFNTRGLFRPEKVCKG